MSPRNTTKKTATQATPGLSEEELTFHIDSAWERRTMLTPEEIEWATRPSVELVFEGMECGEFLVAEPDGNVGWQVTEWLKKAHPKSPRAGQTAIENHIRRAYHVAKKA